MPKIILVYHRINSSKGDYNNITVNPSIFEQHIRYLYENYQILSLENIMNETVSETAIAITFDDGYEDFYLNAYPVLKKYDVPATVFLTTSNLGTLNELWMSEIINIIFFELENTTIEFEFLYRKYKFKITNLEDRIIAYKILRKMCMASSAQERARIINEVCNGVIVSQREEYRVLSEDELNILSKDGIVSFGVHTVSHPSLKHLDYDECKKEIVNAKEMTENIAGQKVKYFSYPFGGIDDFTDREKNILKEVGFEAAFCVDNVQVDNNCDEFSIPRCYVQNYNLKEFKCFIDDILECKSEIDAEYLNYVGESNQDRTILLSEKIAIWGTGNNAEDVYIFLKTKGKEKDICCFIDNDNRKIGSKKYGINVIGAEDLNVMARIHIVIKNNNDVDILNQIYNKNNYIIHWWI